LALGSTAAVEIPSSWQPTDGTCEQANESKLTDYGFGATSPVATTAGINNY
jgi:hypothetical protein